MSATETRVVTGADALVRQLERFGVDVVFGLCGHTVIAALDALARSRIRFVTTHHEQTAAHAADGYARQSGKVGVVLVHVGPGLTNALTGVANAALDSVPLVVVAGDVPSYYYGRHPHQEVNLHADASQAEVYRPVAKRVWRVERADDLPRVLERAFWTAASGRPGAVLVDVPMDLFSRPVSLPEESWPGPGATYARPAPDAAAVREAAEELVRAERPLVVVGGGVRGEEGRRLVSELALWLDLPVAHSLMGKGVLPDDHPLNVGMTGFWGTELANGLAREADVALALGTRFAETDASSWDPRFTWRIPPTRLVHVDLDPAELGRNFPAHLAIQADALLTLRALLAEVRRLCPEGRSRPGLREAVRKARHALWSEVEANGASDAFPLRPERILRDLRRQAPPETVLVTDVGWNKNGVAQRYRLPDEGRFLTPGGLATMGFGPGAALGVQIADPGRPVVALVGDGAMLNQLGAIATAVEYELPVRFVVMNNGAFGTIADLQRSHYGHEYGTTFPRGREGAYQADLAAVARALGAGARRVERAQELEGALSEAFAHPGPFLVDVPMVNEPVPTPGHWNIRDIYRGRFGPS
ncbi:MAG: thiamine pyrophosphate-binding protein [Clostridia bacterium]|nr:thiamine pyrophosphate-binding protein [Clostridia bacterium]